MGWNRLINVLSLGVEYTYSNTQHGGAVDLRLYSAWGGVDLYLYTAWGGIDL